MIQDFIASFPLLYETYFVAMSMGIFLSMLGVVVLARNQIFIAVAISQASVLGIAVSLLWKIPSPLLMAIFFAILASLLTNRDSQAGEVSNEEITGWIFLVASSLSVLLLSKQPHGLRKIEGIMASSIIGATATDLVVCIFLLVLTCGLFFFTQRKLILFISDPVMAAAVGINILLWSWGLSLFTGVIVGVSMSYAGLLYTFGCLVLPALFAKNVCLQTSTMFFVAPIMSFLSILFGLVVSNSLDYPSGQYIVAVMSFLVVVSLGIRKARESFFGK